MIQSKTLWSFYVVSVLIPYNLMATEGVATPHTPTPPQTSTAQVKATPSPKLAANFRPFTGRVVGKKVRMRLHPDVDSPIVKECKKDDLLLVVAEKNGFYVIQPPSDIKAYIFRSFILDGIVEGDHVNVRIAPDRDAPAIGHLSTGTRVNGRISELNNKWLEIVPPGSTNFFVAKEFIEYAGDSNLKATYEQRLSALTQALDSINLFSQAEMHKPYDKIDFHKIESRYQEILQNYSDFKEEVEIARKNLMQCQEKYLYKKIAFLERRASQVGCQKPSETAGISSSDKETTSLEKMRMWEPLEESMYLSWSSMHHAKTMEDFYTDQKLKASMLSGVVEGYREAVKNKPGDFLLTQDSGLPVAFLYSTQINLEEYIGKRVNLSVSERPCNNFAFPAYYVHDIEE
ncbi:MAG: SH3 domain-containing protein [Chlamydiales bacterium]